jgi:polyphosphate kinase 2 (PPK2 family)
MTYMHYYEEALIKNIRQNSFWYVIPGDDKEIDRYIVKQEDYLGKKCKKICTDIAVELETTI